jgi:hypothetical protein
VDAGWSLEQLGLQLAQSRRFQKSVSVTQPFESFSIASTVIITRQTSSPLDIIHFQFLLATQNSSSPFPAHPAAGPALSGSHNH